MLLGLEVVVEYGRFERNGDANKKRRTGLPAVQDNDFNIEGERQRCHKRLLLSRAYVP